METRLIPSPEDFGQAVFSSDGTRIALAGKFVVEVRSVDAGALLARVNCPDVQELAFTPDGRRLVTTGRRTGEVRIWQLSGGPVPGLRAGSITRAVKRWTGSR